MVSFWTMLWMWTLDCLPSFGLRLTGYRAQAPGETTSIMATSSEDDSCEKALTSCEYDWSEAAGCGTTFTLMPVSLVKRLASFESRMWPSPTESPTNVICWPPYFLRIAFAFGTFGVVLAVALCAGDGLLLLAAATLRDAISAIAPTTPARRSSRCFIPPTSFP